MVTTVNVENWPLYKIHLSSFTVQSSPLYTFTLQCHLIQSVFSLKLQGLSTGARLNNTAPA